MDIKEIEEKLERAIEFAKSKGFTIVRDTFLDGSKKICCPLGAAALLYGVSYYKNQFGWNSRNVNDFANGFDGTNFQMNSPIYELGVRLSHKYLLL